MLQKIWKAPSFTESLLRYLHVIMYVMISHSSYCSHTYIHDIYIYIYVHVHPTKSTKMMSPHFSSNVVCFNLQKRPNDQPPVEVFLPREAPKQPILHLKLVTTVVMVRQTSPVIKCYLDHLSSKSYEGCMKLVVH